MMFKPVMLWTDALIFVLLAVILIFAVYVRRHAHLRAPWRGVMRSPTGLASAMVLAVFVVVGLLDSIHYRPALPLQPGQSVQYGVEVLSVLDSLLSDLRTHAEKTYSAPLATHLYAKETTVLADGRAVRIYPRLKYGGAELADPRSGWAADIGMRVALGSIKGLVLAGVLMLLPLLWRALRLRVALAQARQQLAAQALPWRALVFILTMLAVIGCVMVELAAGYHVFGTDKVGQDVLFSTLKSIRTGLVIGTLTTLVMLPFALLLGIMAGYFRGWVDDVIQYLYTTLNSIPGVLLIAAAVLIMQIYIEAHPDVFDTAAARTDFRLLFLCLILGVTSWTGLCRLLRGETLKLRELDYIQAATAFGVSDWRIITRHILPNLQHLVLISVVMDFSGLVLAEAVLSYVGVGVDPAMHSWGNMINSARLEMAREPVVWWQLSAAFVFMFALVLAANLFADSVRDAFDPRGKRA
ncbi:ABC transporter permease [Sulfuriferula sp.]|uniref:ABC transporter permease n=1 Tax=Sulfuriferula sp. TaxID=2025307 RepID=UPI002730B4C7|nr:ABC transporter permease [Sulfuriferula sp.]MDP2025757.1 ABC transporter permease [Sulfuriferula sp.]